MRIRGLLCLATVLPYPLAGQVQSDSTVMAVEQAVAQYAVRYTKNRRLGYEERPHEFATPHERTGPNRLAYRSNEYTTLLAALAGAKVVSLQLVEFCRTIRTDSCLDVVIRIGQPELTSDSATVWLYTYEESKKADWGEEVDIRLLLVKENGRWNVVKVLEERRAYAG